MILVGLIIFIFGLAIGSFLNVVIERTREKKEIIFARSSCPKCQKKIKWYDNIPLISFFLLAGRCRFCHQKIAWQYFFVELVTGILFLINFGVGWSRIGEINFDLLINLINGWVIISFLVIIFLYDLKYYLILDRFIWPAVISVVFFQFFLVKQNQGSMINGGQDFLVHLLCGIIIGSFFALQYFLTSGRGVGGGDMRMGFLMGLILGWPLSLAGLFLAYIIGLLIAVPLLMTKKKGWGSVLPMGTFLSLATLIVFWWGDLLLKWYWSLIS
ncbi:MAG TPA: prepilin peptidase [bacterium]|nr:prepilin peptidase [bacterium]HPL95686.1 prepilin peptidase [bacterium]